jgi:Mg2+-importing ATPase
VSAPTDDSPSGAFWALPQEAVYQAAGSRPTGLTGAEARARLVHFGPNTIARSGRATTWSLLARQFESPIVLILAFATILSGLLGDTTDATIILAIIILSGLLGFWQERGATRAVEALLAMVQIKATVRRDDATIDVPIAEIVPGDVALLQAGDLIPGDGRLTDSNSLLVDEAALTGETYPAEKSPGSAAPDAPIADRRGSLFMGTHVASGGGQMLVLRTAAATEFGQLSARVRQQAPASGFELGMTAFGYLLMRAMVVLVGAIFLVNIVLARPIVDSALFSLALAVGLTPQLLPAIVTISLSQGARLMARERVIVKRLDAIEDFGAMTVLCTDKTGTMTTGDVRLEAAIGADGQPSDRVRRYAALNAAFQTGFANPIDAAIVAGAGSDIAGVRRLADLPYDFTRRRLSVLADDNGRHVMITKGALPNVLAVCASVEVPGRSAVDVGPLLADIRNRYAELCQEGYRVLGVAVRDLGTSTGLAPADESAMTFVGFLTFIDPPKPGAAATVRDLAAAGISVRMVTGDNRHVAMHVGLAVGLASDQLLTGEDLDHLTDAELAERAADIAIFAEIEPTQKERVMRALRAGGRVVGYLGDGINDAPALHAADVGISVDTAVDVAKESAAIVLLDKDLGVLLDGVRQGRRTFANTMKYVFTTTSANFGNMLSMAVASAILPFLPLLADQILLVNFLTDVPSTTIATDDVDREQLEQPHSWDLPFIQKFMLVFGAVSSAFDLLTFAVLRVGFNADATLFRSGWFIESVMTELAVLFVLRTRRPFVRSRPSKLLVLASLAVATLCLGIVYSPFAGTLGLDALPVTVLVTLAAITAAYVATTEVAKWAFYSRWGRSTTRTAGGAGAARVPLEQNKPE